jgi:type IV pilus assembly protein PilM
MTPRRNTTRTPIGVDLGGRSIKAVQLGAAGPNGARRIHAAARFARPAAAPLDAAAAEELANVLERQGFRGRDLVVAIPPAQLTVQMLELPPRASGAPLDQIARLELARLGKLDPNGFEFSFWDLPAPSRSNAGTPALGVAFSHRHAESLIDLLEDQGLAVQGLDTQAWALTRACGPELAPPPATTGVLDIGWDAARLVLVHGGVVIFQRGLEERGLAGLHKKIMAQFDAAADTADAILAACEAPGPDEDHALGNVKAGMVDPFIDALAHDLETSLAYAAHRFPAAPVTRLLLTGGGAALPGIAQRLGARHQIEVKAVRPADVASAPESLQARAVNPGFMVALGLAQPAED